MSFYVLEGAKEFRSCIMPSSRATTAFRKCWENGWSFKGRLGCSTSSAKVQSRFSVSREYTPYVHACIPRCTRSERTRMCTNDLGSKKHAIEIENRSEAGAGVTRRSGSPSSCVDRREERVTCGLKRKVQRVALCRRHVREVPSHIIRCN